MRYLTLGEVLLRHARVLERSGGGRGLRDLGALQSALAQPTMTFDDRDLYPSVETKAAALSYSLAMNHPFVCPNLFVILVRRGFSSSRGPDP
jgi:death on curing protein